MNLYSCVHSPWDGAKAWGAQDTILLLLLLLGTNGLAAAFWGQMGLLCSWGTNGLAWPCLSHWPGGGWQGDMSSSCHLSCCLHPAHVWEPCKTEHGQEKIKLIALGLQTAVDPMDLTDA